MTREKLIEWCHLEALGALEFGMPKAAGNLKAAADMLEADAAVREDLAAAEAEIAREYERGKHNGYEEGYTDAKESR